MADNITIVNCPHCDTSVEWQVSSAWRPFCSERCKLIDLGAWASEEYSVASEQASLMEGFNPDNSASS